MAIEVGDAVFKFLGDTSNMDAAFSSVGPKAKAALAPAEEALEGVGDAANDAGKQIENIPPIPPDVPESVKLTGRQLREARGEAALLGEEMGIRLPRHVRNFISELPGVGSAMSAAFSATAILFIVQALIQGAEKLSNFIATTFIFTKAMKANAAALAESNAEVVKQNALYDKAKDTIDSFNETAVEKTAQNLEDLKRQMSDNAKELEKIDGYYTRLGIHTPQLENQLLVHKATARALEEEVKAGEQLLEQAQKEAALKQSNQATSRGKTVGEAQLNLQEAAAKAMVAGVEKNQLQLFTIEEIFAEKRYQLDRLTLEKQLDAQKKYGHDNEALIDDMQAKLLALQKDHDAKIMDDLSKAKNETTSLLLEMSKTIKEQGPIEIIAPVAVQHILMGRDAAKSLGITLRSDLVEAYVQAKAAQEAFYNSGVKDAVAWRAISVAVDKAKQSLQEYGVQEDKTKIKTETTFAGLVADAHNLQFSTANAFHDLSDAGVQAFNNLSKSMQSALAQTILAQGSFGKAMQHATAEVLAQLAAQAAMKALFYTAEGFAALAGYAYGPASQYFEAAGIMGGVAAVAGVSARLINGSGGGGSNGGGGNSGGPGNDRFSYGGSMSNTGSQAGSGRSSVGVQGFADGGLVSAPTLAMIGEGGGREAALPLDNPEAMATIGRAISDAISVHGGGGVTVHVHGHVLGASDIANLTAQISKRVARGQASLTASSTFRVTKRSA